MYKPIEFEHHVVIFYPNGNVCCKMGYSTAELAYEEYKEEIKWLKHNLPINDVRYVARYNHNSLMTMEEVRRTFTFEEE